MPARASPGGPNAAAGMGRGTTKKRKKRSGDDADRLLAKLSRSADRCRKEASRASQSSGAAGSEQRAVLAERLAELLYETLPKAYAASPRGALPHTIASLHEVMSRDAFVAGASDGDSTRSLAWQALRAYNACTRDAKAEVSGARVEGKRATLDASASGRNRAGEAMLSLFRGDVESAVENDGEDDAEEADGGDRAQLLVMSLLQGFELLAPDDKARVLADA